jgi:hypothetical protein
MGAKPVSGIEQLKLFAASCGESSILKKNKPFHFARIHCGLPQRMRSRADSARKKRE